AGIDSPDYVNIISERHASRLRGHLEDARARGNTVIALLAANSPDPRRLAPHLIEIGCDAGRVMDEEIFGPLLPIVPCVSIDAMIAQIRQRPHPLACYYFGNNAAEIERLTTNVSSGGFCINDLLMHFLQDDLPFGGVGDRGSGNYHGREGFIRFSHAKAVFRQSRLDSGKLPQ